MQAKITNQLIAREAKTDLPKALEIRDTEQNGLLLRVQPKTGTTTYYYVYRKPNGRKSRIKLGRTTDITIPQARDATKKYAGMVVMGGNPSAERQARVRAAKSKITLLVFLDTHYRKFLKSGVKGSSKNGDRDLATFINSLGSLSKITLDQLSHNHIEDWFEKRLKEVAPSTASRSLMQLRGALKLAVSEKLQLIEKNPAEKIECPKFESKRMTPLEYEQESLLRKALTNRDEELKAARRRHNVWLSTRGKPPRESLDNQLYADRLTPMVLLSLLTGLRQSEMLTLDWSDLSIKSPTNWQITVSASKSKSGRERYVPLPQEAREILESLPRKIEGGPVFPDASGKPYLEQPRKPFASVLVAADINGFRWHDLRHTYASNLVRNGIDLYRVQKLLGHSSIATTERYAHLSPENLTAAVSVLGRIN